MISIMNRLRGRAGFTISEPTKVGPSGFTIVELLIVIVVIGILASITFLSYTAVHTSAKSDSARANASVVGRKIEAYGSVKNAFPDATTAADYETALNSLSDSAIDQAGLHVGTPDSGNGTTTLEVSQCADNPGGAYRVRYWDFGQNGLADASVTGSIAGPCSNWTVLQ